MKWSAALTGLLLLWVASSAGALVVETWTRRSLQFSNLGRAELSATATGLATLNTSAASSHLSTLTVSANPDLAFTGAMPITDPDDPRITSLLVSIRSRPDLQGGGVIGNISGAVASSAGGLTPATIPATGGYTVCLLVAPLPPCVAQLPLAVGVTTGAGAWVGSGVGGLLTINTYYRISLIGAPFTAKTVSVVNRTANGAFEVFQEHGFAHGPLSLTASTAEVGGVLQLLTATRTPLGAVSGAPDQIAQISRTLIHIVPEPGRFLLFAWGALGIAWLGTRRVRS